MSNEIGAETNTLIEKVDLATFIKENQSILTVFGVFIALTSYFISQKDTYPSVFSLLLAIVVAFELWVKFPRNEQASIRLEIFEFLFYMLMMYMILKFIGEYIYYLVTFCFFILLIPFCYLNLKFIERYMLFKYVRCIAPSESKKSEIIRGIFALLLFSPAVIGSFLFSKVIIWCVSTFIG